MGRNEIPVDLASPACFSIAKEWISSCCVEHRDTCGDNPLDPLLSTRVVDVGTVNGVEDLKLFVCKGDRGRYVALSHCWGGNIETVLTTENLLIFSAVD